MIFFSLSKFDRLQVLLLAAALNSKISLQFLPVLKPQSEIFHNDDDYLKCHWQPQQQRDVKRKIFTESIMKMCHRHTNLIFNLFTSPHPLLPCHVLPYFPSHFPRSLFFPLMAPTADVFRTCMLSMIKTTAHTHIFFIHYSCSRCYQLIAIASSSSSSLIFVCGCHCCCWCYLNLAELKFSVCFSKAMMVSCVRTIKGEEITLMFSPWQC